MREGARVVRIGDYRGVAVDVLDLSSLSTTGTFKDWIAATVMAEAVAHAHPVVIAQSSGNTGNAIARYAAQAAIQCVILYPPASRRRILPELAALPGVHFIEVDAPETQIKQALADASQRLGIPTVPDLNVQYEANKLRAYVLRDAAEVCGHSWDWHAQALSSAYGPLGFYQGLREMRSAVVPRFLGVQQEAVSPFAAAIGGQSGDPAARMLEPTLFRAAPPPSLVSEVRQVCAESGGTVRMLSNKRYLRLERRAVAALEAAGVAVTRDPGGEPRERAGLYSLVGAWDAIDKGEIEPGHRVLAVHTGGSGPAAELFQPRHATRVDGVVAAAERALAGHSHTVLAKGH